MQNGHGWNDDQRQAYLDYRARCMQAFTPYAPIDLPDFFAGRSRQIERLRDQLDSPGRQIAIFGERGVGKTSFAKLAYFFANREEDNTHFVRCETQSTFDSIFTDVLAKSGVAVELNGIESNREIRGTIGGKLAGAGAASSSKRIYRRIKTESRIDSSLLLDQFTNQDGLIIIDEFDRVRDSDTFTRLSELIKHFSDAKSKTKIILVGVANTLAQLLGEHASLTRALAQIKLERMPHDELRDILMRGEERLAAKFSESVKRRIVCLSDGFPYFVHLVAQQAALEASKAITRKDYEPLAITERHYRLGLDEAFANCEQELAEQFEEAIVTTRKATEKYELVLRAMAVAVESEVQVRDLVTYASYFTGRDHQPSEFSHHLGKLTKTERKCILTKIREGFYKFSNPLMRPYVRLKLEVELEIGKEVERDQLEFPFMRP